MDKVTATRGVRLLPDDLRRRAAEGEHMASTAATPMRYVVGIDVAKHTHVICALEAPDGAIRHQPSAIAASAEGYALLVSWLATWRAAAPPEALLIGLEATGVLWEPLDAALTQAG
jgi:hypothetical protein